MDRTSAGGFIPYPTNRVAGTIADSNQASRAVDALLAAGFDRDAVDVLHGPEDLRRLDPAGSEHGVFAKLQRSLIRGGAGFELKHLTHHVEDVQAGRFVVMVLAPERKARDVAAETLHAHGAEFVGFYGRWAYESLPEQSSKTASPVGASYDIGAGQDVVRVRVSDGTAEVVGSPNQLAVATSLGANRWLISWRHGDAAMAHVIDVDGGTACTSVMSRDGAPTHVKGTVRRVE